MNTNEVKIEQESMLQTIVEHYFAQINKEVIYKNEFNTINATLLVLGEAYSLLSDKKEADELIYQHMLYVKQHILENKLYYTPSLYNGLGEVALTTYSIYQNTGMYGKFLDKINILLVDWTRNYLNELEFKENLRTEHFDTILGISGIANYFLLLEQSEQYTNLLKEILEKLVYISGYKEIDNKLIPRWYIKSENLIMPKDRLNYPNGNINFGLAHGIAGPLVVLSKAYAKNIVVQGQLEAINNIINEYKKTSYKVNDSTYWPSMLSPEAYWDGCESINQYRTRESWCYGPISIARALLIAGQAIQDEAVSRWAYSIIEQKSEFPIEDFLLVSPTVCHGYAGVLAILNSTNRMQTSAKLRQSLNRVNDKIQKSYDKNSKYGFWDIEIEIENNKEKIIREDRNTFLDGTAGIILTLLSYNNYGKNIIESKLLI